MCHSDASAQNGFELVSLSGAFFSWGISHGLFGISQKEGETLRAICCCPAVWFLEQDSGMDKGSWVGLCSWCLWALGRCSASVLYWWVQAGASPKGRAANLGCHVLDLTFLLGFLVLL